MVLLTETCSCNTSFVDTEHNDAGAPKDYLETKMAQERKARGRRCPTNDMSSAGE